MGKVYILTNEYMPGLIKIGKTNGDLKDRMKELDKTGVPYPFTFYFAIETAKFNEIEKFIHAAFEKFRVRKNREFFEMDPEHAVAALRISGAKEIVLENISIDETGQEIFLSQKKINRKNNKISFQSLRIPVGSELEFTRNSEIKCTVKSDHLVEYNSQDYSLSGLAKKLMSDLGYNWSTVRGPSFFSYNGSTISDMIDQKNSENDEEIETATN